MVWVKTALTSRNYQALPIKPLRLKGTRGKRAAKGSRCHGRLRMLSSRLPVTIKPKEHTPEILE